MMSKKQSMLFFISVEGINCEKMYFEHLAKLINNSDSVYKIKINVKKMQPYEFAKRSFHLYNANFKNNKKIPFFHIQDIEDYYNTVQRNKFFTLVDELRKAEKDFRILYELGYSNYTFELWLLLHVADMTHSVQNRNSYLAYVNRYFNKNYSNLNQYKQEDEFCNILNEFITLQSVKMAIDRAEKILQYNINNNKQQCYKKFNYFQNNPDLTVHRVVQKIFNTCEVK